MLVSETVGREILPIDDKGLQAKLLTRPVGAKRHEPGPPSV
jgi:hypothetical protein